MADRLSILWLYKKNQETNGLTISSFFSMAVYGAQYDLHVKSTRVCNLLNPVVIEIINHGSCINSSSAQFAVVAPSPVAMVAMDSSVYTLYNRVTF